jgi:hypothetical protein
LAVRACFGHRPSLRSASWSTSGVLARLIGAVDHLVDEPLLPRVEQRLAVLEVPASPHRPTKPILGHIPNTVAARY